MTQKLPFYTIETKNQIQLNIFSHSHLFMLLLIYSYFSTFLSKIIRIKQSY